MSFTEDAWEYGHIDGMDIEALAQFLSLKGEDCIPDKQFSMEEVK